jgi:hypothetical protein
VKRVEKDFLKAEQFANIKSESRTKEKGEFLVGLASLLGG